MPKFALVALLLALLAPGSAQQKPNFSGVWVGKQEPQPRISPTDPWAFQLWATGQPVTITHDGKVITIAYTLQGRSRQPVLLTYNLDGTETRNAFSGPNAKHLASTAVWDGESLVLITVASSSDLPTAVRHEYRDRLTLESSTTFRLETSHVVNGQQATAMARFQRTLPAQGRGSVSNGAHGIRTPTGTLGFD